MEMDLATADDFDDQNNNNNDYSSLEGEKCGICMDVVIDRGVLDCCQHWFCFTCIDNWATITNLCPLCQNEFQSITCVPVFDTIGSNRDDDTLSREDDWNIEGENNTLSFPSYYIDENAVICLDGDGCKIRNGSVTIEDDPDLDTSIACDSCDIWYHAFCVGFDTESTCGTSWLCPGCIANEKSEISTPSPHAYSLNVNGERLVEATLSQRVSVSIADAGETAVVVSMVEKKEEKRQEPCQTQYTERNQMSEGPCENLLATTGVDDVLKVEMPNSSSSVDLPKLAKALENIGIKPLKLEAASLAFPCPAPEQRELKAKSTDIPLNECSAFDGPVIPSSDLLEEPCSTKKPCGRNPTHRLDFSESPSLSAGEHTAGNIEKKSTSEGLLLDANVAPEQDNSRIVTGMKRKSKDYGYDIHTASGDEETNSKVVTKASRKKVRFDRRNSVIEPEAPADKFTASGSRRSNPKREQEDCDIMSIVQGPDRRQREKAAGLRVKKIMRRDTENKESSMLVQKLRTEIKEAIRNKSELGASQVNPELLAAFRVAVSGPVSESAKNSPALVLKAKKVIFQKGKVRENLTKKIYGIGGKRKRAWTRDCDIEFWKHRCLQAGRPEKIDTLKSVLDLLRKSSDGTGVKEGAEDNSKPSILSRLYVADTSLFPRKDDIKPLSDFDANSASKNIEPSTVASLSTSAVADLSISSAGNHVLKTQHTSKVSTQGLKCVNIKGEAVAKSNDVKKDKKQWALEILARKTAVTSSKSTNGTIQEDNPVLKKNYPLLAQLPVDMKPELAPSRHNKIPISVRQAQLHRLTEHFLRKANLPVIRRTADTELAVADAVNIEKEIADKSNSKLVYTNLMSQQVSHRVENTNSNRVVPDLDPTLLATPSERSEETLEDPSNDPSVQEALRKAGLLSDSPPNSPCHRNPEANEPLKETEEEHDNILEIGSHPEVDIYGDFEYNLEDEDFIGASDVKTSKPQEDDSKIKVVFSTFALDKLDVPIDDKGQEGGTEVKADMCSHQDPKINGRDGDLSLIECEELYGPDKEPLVKKFPESEKFGFSESSKTVKDIFEDKILPEDVIPPCGGEDAPVCSETSEYIPKEDKLSDKNIRKEEKLSDTGTKRQSDCSDSISKKVEAYIKEHIRPLCKSKVITVEQYRWAVEKTTEKVMKYHSKEENAKFLIKEGDKVKKLAEQYVEASQHKKKK